ncbi:hypothetical protein MXD95_011035 [Frankia sp. AiPa1]|nr:hypothetical protein [Frankia sp. AiPa1]
MSQDALSRRIGFHRTRISKAENGELPSVDLCAALDEHWQTGGELASYHASLDPSGHSQHSQHDQKEDPTDRRRLVQLAALSALAFETTSRIDACASAPTLSELEDDVTDIASGFDATPRPALIAEVAGRWHQVETMLERRLNVTDSHRATLLAGQLSYYLGRLAFTGGHYRDARRFADLSDRYAAQVGDAALVGSLAALRSSIAYYTQRWDEAAITAARARLDAPPHLTARLAAYEARSHARLGRIRETQRALADMNAARQTSTITRPGSSPFTAGSAAMFDAVCAVELGDGAQARRQASQAVDLTDPCSHEERGHAYLCLAAGYLLQDQPDPAAAAAAGRAAVTVPDGHLSATVVSAVSRLVRDLGPWSSDPDVRALGALVHQSRLALPGSAP